MKTIILSLIILLSSCEEPTPERIYPDHYPAELTASEVEMMDLINNNRTNNGLSLLKSESEAQRLAQEHLEEIIATNHPSHNGLDQRCKYLESIGAIIIRENVAAYFSSNENMFKAYLESDGHRNNIRYPGLTHNGVASQDGYNVCLFVTFPN